MPRKKTGGRPPVLTLENVEPAIEQAAGNLAAVARMLKVDRSSVAHFVAKEARLAGLLDDCRQAMKDNAESALYKAVLAGEAWAVCFFLKTQARDRGYTERPEPRPPLETVLALFPEEVARELRKALGRQLAAGGGPARGRGRA